MGMNRYGKEHDQKEFPKRIDSCGTLISFCNFRCRNGRRLLGPYFRG